MEKEQNTSVLTSADLDVLGEILNISMGASATAISTMLDKQVLITTPKLEMKKSDDVDYHDLEPALIVKIKYIEGVFMELMSCCSIAGTCILFSTC